MIYVMLSFSFGFGFGFGLCLIICCGIFKQYEERLTFEIQNNEKLLKLFLELRKEKINKELIDELVEMVVKNYAIKTNNEK